MSAPQFEGDESFRQPHDVALMTAIIGHHCRDDYDDHIPQKHLKAAAAALYEAGFRMGSGSTDEDQNDRLSSIEDRLSRIEGYMVIPTHYGTGPKPKRG